jgi:hypothetical protein
MYIYIYSPGKIHRKEENHRVENHYLLSTTYVSSSIGRLKNNYLLPITTTGQDLFA